MIKDVENKNPFIFEILKYLPKKFCCALDEVIKKNVIPIFEIRIKVNSPLILRSNEGIKFLSLGGEITNKISKASFIVSKLDVDDIYNKICEYSVHSYQDQIKNGFITVSGGHRIGICGTAVKKDNLITSIKNISSLNIRIAREVIGASDKLLNLISPENFGLLIVGPPSCGKTTILRDLARKLSCEKGKCVTIVDERSEIAATYNGVPKESVGLCDVMNGYPKKEGILQAIRTMSPEIIICDELGDDSDAESIKQGLNAGVSIIASIHASSIDDLLSRTQAKKLINTGAFKKIVILKDSKNPGQVKQIIGADELYA